MGQRSKKIYGQDYKSDAVGLAERLGVTQAAAELGVNQSNIRRWIQEGRRANYKAQDGQSISDIEKENRRLKREINDLKKINEVLKKATAFFSGNQI